MWLNIYLSSVFFIFIWFHITKCLYIFLQFWRITLLFKVFLVDSFFFFSFSTLNISSHSLLVCKVSAEKSTDSFGGEVPYMWWVSFTFQLSRFSLCLWFLTVIENMSQWSLLWVETYWGILSFMYLDVHIFPQIRKVFSQYCFK